MTGYGSGESRLPDETQIVVEVRAVNHRYFDARPRLGSQLTEYAPTLEEVARRKLERGRIEMGARMTEGRGAEPVLDRVRARSAFQQLCELRDELRPDEPVPLALLASVPDLFVAAEPSDHDALHRAVTEAAELACDAVTRMREREGEALATDLTTRLAQIEARTAELTEQSPRVVEAYREKLHERVRKLLADSSAELDPGRLEHEVALFADRVDVAEELARLQSHCQQFRELVERPLPRGVGRRLDFLLQEMTREVNTAGAKSADSAMTRTVVDLKAEIERMREQVQNVL